MTIDAKFWINCDVCGQCEEVVGCFPGTNHKARNPSESMCISKAAGWSGKIRHSRCPKCTKRIAIANAMTPEQWSVFNKRRGELIDIGQAGKLSLTLFEELREAQAIADLYLECVAPRPTAELDRLEASLERRLQ